MSCVVSLVVCNYCTISDGDRYKYPKDVRGVMSGYIDIWMKKGVGKKRKFQGGDKPNLADLVSSAINQEHTDKTNSFVVGIRTFLNKIGEVVCIKLSLVNFTPKLDCFYKTKYIILLLT